MENSEQETDGLALRYRVLLKIAALLERYYEWRRPDCPCCGVEMGKLVPQGYTCFNEDCKAHMRGKAYAKMVSDNE